MKLLKRLQRSRATATPSEKPSVVGSCALIASIFMCFGRSCNDARVDTEGRKRVSKKTNDVEEQFRDAYESYLDVYLDSFFDDTSKLDTFGTGETKDTRGFLSAPGAAQCEPEREIIALSPGYVLESPLSSAPSSRRPSSFERCRRRLVFD